MKEIGKAIATVAVVLGASYGEIHGAKGLFIGAVFICYFIWC